MISKMDEFIKFNNQTAGRDKIFRLAQYTCRILWFSLEKRRSCINSAEKAKRVDESLGMMRRLLRFGRFFETFHSALPVMSSVSDPVVRMTSVLSRISSGCFMIIDHIVCLDKLGVLSKGLIDSSKWDKTSLRFWLYSIILGLIRDFYEISRIYKEECQTIRSKRIAKSHHQPILSSALSESQSPIKSRKKSDCDKEGGSGHVNSTKVVECMDRVRRIGKCTRDHADVAVDTLKNFCDLFIPLNALGFIHLNPAVIGLIGVISTIASAMPQINPMIKMVPAT